MALFHGRTLDIRARSYPGDPYPRPHMVPPRAKRVAAHV